MLQLCLDEESSLLVCSCIFRRSSSYIGVIGPRSSNRNKKGCLCIMFVGDMLLIESLVYFVSLLFGIYEFFATDRRMCVHFCSIVFEL